MSGEKRRFLWRGFVLGLTIVTIAFVSGRPNSVNKVLASSAATRRAAIITRADQGFKAEAKRGNDLATYTFTTPRGSKITANFTDDLAASDTLTGTVETEPAGKTPSEVSESQGELQGCVIEVAKQPSPVTEKILRRTLPSIVTPEVRDIVLKYRGEEVARGELPVAETTSPAPTDITLPTGGQHGRPIAVKCPCAERSPQDYVKIGGTILPELASSPRKKVFRNTSETVGLTQIECQHAGVVKRGEFRNISIGLSAPKTQLTRGEKTTLQVTVNGLEGIKSDVPLELENRSPETIDMQGGVDQRTLIHPGDVQSGGVYRTERGLTGIQAGSFGITGTVTWAESGRPTIAGETATPGGPQTRRDPDSDYEEFGLGCGAPVPGTDGTKQTRHCVTQSACKEHAAGCGCHLFGAPNKTPDDKKQPWEHKADPGIKTEKEADTEYQCSCVKKKK